MTFLVILASLILAVVAPAKPAPISELHYLVGAWSCTYRAGAMRLAYNATYAYDLGGHTLRETASWAGGGDEELFSYDAQRHGWTAVVLDDHGNATIMHGSGNNPNHVAYRSVYPDASIAETFDHISATEYALHARVHSGTTTTTSVDMCLRIAH